MRAFTVHFNASDGSERLSFFFFFHWDCGELTEAMSQKMNESDAGP